MILLIEGFTNLQDATDYYRVQLEIPESFIFTVFDALYDYQIGICGYRDNTPEYLKIQSGYLVFSPVVRGTKCIQETLQSCL